MPDFSLLHPKSRYLLAISGGGDSMALAHLLREAGLGKKVDWAHFNHRWNPTENEAEAFLCAQAKALGAKLHLGKAATKGRPTTNAEAKARAERHAFFASVCKTHGYAGVLLGHTQTDTAETFLMRAGKGSGLSGLAAMQPVSTVGGLTLIRPLLSHAREELRSYLKSHNHAWLEDPDNLNNRSQRAKIRSLLPALEAAGIPVAGLAATAKSLWRTESMMIAYTNLFMKKYPTSIPLKELSALPKELALRVLAKRIEILTETQAPRTTKRQALLLKIVGTPSGKATLGRVIWRWGKGQLTCTLE